MKKLPALILALILVSSVFTCVMAAPAYAEGTYNVVCGTYYDAIYERDFSSDGRTISSITMVSGTLQSGLQLDFSGSRCFIKGTPMEEDNRYIEFTVGFTDSTTQQQYVRIISTRGSRDASKNVSCKKGEGFSANIYDAIGTLSSFNATWNGIKLESNGSVLVLSGTPADVGSYTFSGSVVDANVVDVKFNIAVTVTADAVKITKSPSHETCAEGDSALFISAAENYSQVEWRVVTADGGNCWRDEAEIENKFPGVSVTIYTGDDNREYLALKNIPYSMNGYYIQTKFWGLDKKSFELTETHSALLTVERSNLQQARINSNPSNASLQPGQTTQLSISASSPDGHTLKYQWYRNSTASTSGGSIIQGATSPSYTPSQESGTVYYYCSVINVDGERTSAPAYSSVASVTYLDSAAQPVQPLPTAEAQDPAGDEKTGQKEDEEVKKEDEKKAEDESKQAHKKEKKDSSFVLALGIVVAVALGCGTLIYINMRKRS